MLPRAAESDDTRTENVQGPGSAQALRLVPHSSPAPRDGSGIGLAFHGADDEEDWETLLTRAKADAERRDEPSEDDEWEWAAQMQRVKAQLAHTEDDEWEAAVARARAQSADASRPVARVHVGPQSERAPTVHAARARMMKAPQRSPARPSSTPVEATAEGAPSLYFTLPDEKPAEPAKLPEEVSKVVARATIMPDPGTGTRAALPPARTSGAPVAAKPAVSEKAPAAELPRASLPPVARASLPMVERTSMTAVPPRTSLAAVPPRKTVPEARRTSYLEATRSSGESRPESAPSKSKQSSPGMAALRVAATKRSTDVTPRVSQPARQSVERVSAPVARASQPAEEPKKKDSSLVGLEAALVEQMAMAKRTGRGAPPPPPPAAAYAQRGQAAPMRAPQPRSSRAPLKVPPPPPRSSVPARQPLKIPPPPPPSSAKQGVPERVVSRVKNAVAVLTRRGGVRG
jgi:hypothetical protein